MANEVIVFRETYKLVTFDNKECELTEEQYNNLESILLDTQAKFVKIGGTIFNTSSIKELSKKMPEGAISEETLKWIQGEK